MKKEVKPNEKYKGNSTGNIYTVVSVYNSLPNTTIIQTIDEKGITRNNDIDYFLDFHTKIEDIAPKRKPNINEDIIKLINSGFEFKSFFGDTVDDKSLHIELEE